MTAIERTAYPRFKRNLTAKDLAEVYTPTPGERFLAARSTKGSVAEVGFLVLLKTYQRLGRFILLSEVPVSIVEYIARLIDPHLDVSDLDSYDSSGTRQRHISLIRAAQQLKPYSPAARTCLLKAMFGAARTKEDLADLINVALEELARECFELPPFATLDKAAHHVRAMTTRGLYRRISQAIPQEARAALDALFVVEDGARLSGWEQLKQEPASPTLTHLRDLIDHLFVISEQRKLLPPRLFEGLAEGKIKQLATEARALDATEMKDLELHKRFTLAAAFVQVQSAEALDDLAEMFIKRMLAIHQKGKDALERYRVEHQARTDALVLTLRDLVTAYGKEGTSEERLAAMESVIGDQAAKILLDCEEHLAHVGNNYQPFLWPFYKGHRAQLFRLLSVMTFRSSSQDRSLQEAIVFLKDHESSRGEWLITATMQNPGTPEEQRLPLVDLSWASDTWWKLMTGQSKREDCPDKVLRRHFEIAIFSQLVWELADLSFVQTATNIVFLGPPGVGKTHLSLALTVKALAAGYSALFTTLTHLAEVLDTASYPGLVRQRLRRYTTPSVLVIDEVGYTKLSPGQAHHFFELVTARYEHGSILLTSNTGFSEWGSLLGDEVLATALLDRLLHHAEVIPINGRSYRMKDRRETSEAGGQK